MPPKIYPNCARMNNFSGIYCKIAMESYYRATGFYKEIQAADFSWDKCAEKYEFQKMVISTIVFSAMCLESFFNDYIAAVLGDDRYYNTYDILTPQNKFCFISEFLFRKPVDKSQECYGGIKNLVQYRNNYIHNKSAEVNIQLPTDQYLKECEEIRVMTDHEEMPLLNKRELDIALRKALEALKAIRNVARYFEKHDASCHAMVRLFGEYNYYFSSSYEQKYMGIIFQELGIKRGNK